ncbi:MAG: hypothetical protein NDI77_09115 [Geobacteraceae bacterium]|nr:hypothetical protein [Geobacteraceae bacterium]
MAPQIGVLTVHGMGSQQSDFAEEMIAELKEKMGGNADDVCWEAVYWAPVLSERQEKVWADLSAGHDIDWVKLRKFFLNAFGDAAAYRYVPGKLDSSYYRIHDLVHTGLQSLRSQLGGDAKPLIVIAHSLGSVIMSNYIWDRQHGTDAERYGQTSFERMESLAGIVTFGCNIPLFVLAYEPVECITFPPATLSDGLKAKARWLNFFDSDDILGWPLKALSSSYSAAVTEDREINAGGILTSWNPASHSDYWTDNDFTRPVAEFIGGFV